MPLNDMSSWLLFFITNWLYLRCNKRKRKYREHEGHICHENSKNKCHTKNKNQFNIIIHYNVYPEWEQFLQSLYYFYINFCPLNHPPSPPLAPPLLLLLLNQQRRQIKPPIKMSMICLLYSVRSHIYSI